MPNREPTLSEKACFVIDCLFCEGTIAETLEWRIAAHKNYKITNEELDDVVKLFGIIYRLAHVGNNPSCIKVHDDWIKKLEELYTKFKGEK